MQGHHGEGHHTAVGHGFIDPVCGMQVSEASPHRTRVGEVEYRFCSATCLERFARDPGAFLSNDAER